MNKTNPWKTVETVLEPLSYEQTSTMKTRQPGMAHSNATLVIDENEPMLVLSNDRPFLEFFQTLPYAVVPFFSCPQKKEIRRC